MVAPRSNQSDSTMGRGVGGNSVAFVTLTFMSKECKQKCYGGNRVTGLLLLP